MLGNMLSYPFALLTRKPATVLGAYFAFFLFLVGLDIAFAALGQDLLSADADLLGESRAAYQGYTFFAGLFGLGIAALVMGAALIDLKRRAPEDRPLFLEGGKFFALNLQFSFLVVLPFAIVAVLVTLGVSRFVPAFRDGELAPIWAVAPLALPLCYVAIRLYLAWPRALAADDISLLRAWPLTKGKVGMTLGLFLAAHAVGMAPLLAWSFLSQLLELYVWEPVDTLEAVLTPGALGYSAAVNAATAFSTVYLAITPAFMFDAFDPIKPDVAEVF
jgi:hypothetical protein